MKKIDKIWFDVTHSAYQRTDTLKDKVNEIIDHLNSTPIEKSEKDTNPQVCKHEDSIENTSPIDKSFTRFCLDCRCWYKNEPKKEEYDHYMGYIGKTPEPKQSTSLKEECTDPRGNKLTTSGDQTYHQFNTTEPGFKCGYCGKQAPKKSTALKEEIIKMILPKGASKEMWSIQVEMVLSLIQSHLLKEMIPPKYTRDMESAGYNQCRGDVIKFICETLSK